MNKGLKPCPFCGGEAVINILLGNYCVTCTECNGSIFPAAGMTEEEAIEAWNRRKPMDEIVEQLEDLSKEHPYKVIGDPDTYSQYNEAWQDCIDRANEIIWKFTHGYLVKTDDLKRAIEIVEGNDSENPNSSKGGGIG